MRSAKYGILAALILGVVGVGAQTAEKKDKPKTIKQVMHAAHQGKEEDDPTLQGIVTDGKGTAEQKKLLLSLYMDLAKNKPPMGKEEDWKKKVESIVSAAKEVVDGKKDAEIALRKVTACGPCHREFRPEKKE